MKYVKFLLISSIIFMVNINGVLADINSSGIDDFTTLVSQDDRDFNWGVDYMSISKLIHEAKKSKSSVRIAVLDCGFDLNAPVFKGVKIEDPYDVTGDGDTDIIHPTCSHGSVVAGIIATMIKDTNITLIPVKIARDSEIKGSAYYFDMDIGYDYAIEKKADIINLSYGMHDSIFYQFYNSPLYKFVGNGGIFVTASGNESEEISSIKKDYLDLVVVGAIDDSGERALFSNYGPSLDFTAPGTDFFLYGSRYGVTGGSGTSYASPQVAGIMSLLKLAYPDKSRDELVEILKKYTNDLGDTGFDIYYGSGAPNFMTLNDFGSGRSWKKNGTMLYENGKLVTGWHYIDTAWYFFNSNGVLQKNKIINNELPGYGKGKRYVGEDGMLVVGWDEKNASNKDDARYFFRYFDPDTGIMVTNKTITIENEDYTFNSSGKLIARGVKKMPSDVVADAIYKYLYFDKNNLVVTDKTFVKTKKGTYLLDDGAVVNDVDDIDFLNYMYYPDPVTFLLKSNSWYNDEDDSYYFGSNFKSVKGLNKIDGNLYYFDLDGFFMITDEFKTIKKVRYYFGNDGKAVKGWNTIEGKVYFFGDDYKAYKGLKKVDGNLYYFQKNKGYMLTNMLVILKNKIMYFKDDGTAQKGWQSVDNNRYYFGKDYYAVKGLKKINKKYYYFNTKTGAMLVNSNVKVNKVKYHCDNDGVCKKK